MPSRVLAVTGTPCTGKTTLCKKISPALGYPVIDLNELVKKERLFSGHDKARDTKVVDVRKLKRRVHSLIDSDTILDGLLSHLLNPTHILVLRCDPRLLVMRMKKRGYSREKIMENLEAEYVGVLLEESMRLCDNVLELDNTNGANVGKIIGWVRHGGEKIIYKDWSKEFIRTISKL